MVAGGDRAPSSGDGEPGALAAGAGAAPGGGDAAGVTEAPLAALQPPPSGAKGVCECAAAAATATAAPAAAAPATAAATKAPPPPAAAEGATAPAASGAGSAVSGAAAEASRGPPSPAAGGAPPAAGPLAAAAAATAELKRRARDALFASRVAEATALYEAALASAERECEAEVLPCLNNLALCHLRAGEFSAAATRASAVLERQPQNEKALYRRCAAREALGETAGALADAQLLAALGNRDVLPALARLRAAAAAVLGAAAARLDADAHLRAFLAADPGESSGGAGPLGPPVPPGGLRDSSSSEGLPPGSPRRRGAPPCPDASPCPGREALTSLAPLLAAPDRRRATLKKMLAADLFARLPPWLEAAAARPPELRELLRILALACCEPAEEGAGGAAAPSGLGLPPPASPETEAARAAIRPLFFGEFKFPRLLRGLAKESQQGNAAEACVFLLADVYRHVASLDEDGAALDALAAAVFSATPRAAAALLNAVGAVAHARSQRGSRVQALKKSQPLLLFLEAAIGRLGEEGEGGAAAAAAAASARSAVAAIFALLADKDRRAEDAVDLMQLMDQLLLPRLAQRPARAAAADEAAEKVAVALATVNLMWLVDREAVKTFVLQNDLLGLCLALAAETLIPGGGWGARTAQLEAVDVLLHLAETADGRAALLAVGEEEEGGAAAAVAAGAAAGAAGGGDDSCGGSNGAGGAGGAGGTSAAADPTDAPCGNPPSLRFAAALAQFLPRLRRESNTSGENAAILYIKFIALLARLCIHSEPARKEIFDKVDFIAEAIAALQALHKGGGKAAAKDESAYGASSSRAAPVAVYVEVLFFLTMHAAFKERLVEAAASSADFRGALADLARLVAACGDAAAAFMWVNTYANLFQSREDKNSRLQRARKRRGRGGGCPDLDPAELTALEEFMERLPAHARPARDAEFDRGDAAAAERAVQQLVGRSGAVRALAQLVHAFRHALTPNLAGAVAAALSLATRKKELAHTIVAEGGVRALLRVCGTLRTAGADFAEELAAARQALSHLCIYVPATLLSYEDALDVGAQVEFNLEHDFELYQFEAAMALTNLTAVRPEVRARLAGTPSPWRALMEVGTGENPLCRAAAVECMCNLAQEEPVQERFVARKTANLTHLELLLAFAADDENARAQSAAAGCLALLTSDLRVAAVLCGVRNFAPLIDMLGGGGAGGGDGASDGGGDGASSVPGAPGASGARGVGSPPSESPPETADSPALRAPTCDPGLLQRLLTIANHAALALAWKPAVSGGVAAGEAAGRAAGDGVLTPPAAAGIEFTPDGRAAAAKLVEAAGRALRLPAGAAAAAALSLEGLSASGGSSACGGRSAF